MGPLISYPTGGRLSGKAKLDTGGWYLSNAAKPNPIQSKSNQKKIVF